ncbi:hypothetical protein [Catellatospora chokoriensis]|uniref:Uncharacterized protein n=1 Tax=Catellatospora chokoriensis TaxID=310353 RepID=A0A8J3NW78_9ACTN|nr:hypothetical protein [Catellatospora chokoriensis]GIF94900.1 hypothetical protein Cch02nite_83440 [Catellatospora chokoriensis]
MNRPIIEPGSDMYTQLFQVVDWISYELADEHTDRQLLVEAVQEHLADMARRWDRNQRARRSMTAIATGPGAVVIQAGGDIRGTFRD